MLDISVIVSSVRTSYIGHSTFRARELKNVPFSQKEAEAAAGMGSYVAPKHFDTDATSSNVSVTTDMETMSITSP